jgi:hypothetical protein
MKDTIMINQELINREYDMDILDALTTPIGEAIENQAALEQANYENVRAAFVNNDDVLVDEIYIRNIAEQLGLEPSTNGARSLEGVGRMIVAPWVVMQPDTSRCVRYVGLWALRESVDASVDDGQDDRSQEFALSAT